MTTVLITGNTYAVKDRLKAIGGRWNADAKGWDVPSDRADEARAIVAGAGPVKSSSVRRSRSCGCKGKYHSSWCPRLYGPGGYYDRLEGNDD